MSERKFEKKFFKKNHIQTPNGVLLIFKLPFPNGSHHNGVCRALWAKSAKKSRQNIICTYVKLFANNYRQYCFFISLIGENLEIKQKQKKNQFLIEAKLISG